MDLIRLGEYNNVDPTYLPDRMLEGFTTKIWTERFRDPGEFLLKTPHIEMSEILSEMTLISHRHTKEVMMVETILIVEDENGNEELTISGRSVDSILESRFVEGVYQKRRKMARQYTPNGAALALIWNSVDNNTGFDVTRLRKDDDDPDNEDPNHDGPRWEWNLKDLIPNIAVSDSVTISDDLRRWWLREGLLYPQLMRVLAQGDLGIRTIRPPSAASTAADRIWVRSTLTELGDIARDSTFNYGQIRFDVFNGLDRSHTQSANERVIFNVRRGHIDKPSHLWSVKEWKTGVEVMSDLNRKKDIYREGQSGFTGWHRRTMTYDAGAPEIPPRPEDPGKNATQAENDKYERKLANWRNRRDNIINEFENDYEKDALRELNKFRKVSLFSGDISPEGAARYKFKTHYNLGDTVTLRGRRGLQEKALVTEHVLTEDAEGERGFPGLTIIGE